MNGRYFSVIGAVLAAAGVMLGAYHAHGLEASLAKTGADATTVQHHLENAEVAVRYQMYHAIALLVLGSLFAGKRPRLLAIGCWLLCIGVLCFSGGLYLIVFAGTALHWAIVPLGGMTLIVAWFIIAVALAIKPDV